MAAFLIENGANVNSTRNGIFTPLIVCAFKDQEVLAIMLIQAKAKIPTKDAIFKQLFHSKCFNCTNLLIEIRNLDSFIDYRSKTTAKGKFHYVHNIIQK